MFTAAGELYSVTLVFYSTLCFIYSSCEMWVSTLSQLFENMLQSKCIFLISRLGHADWPADLQLKRACMTLCPYTNPPSGSSQKMLIRLCAVLLMILSAVMVVPWPGLNWASLLVNYVVQQAAGWALIQIRAVFPAGPCLPTIERTMNIHTAEESHYKQSLQEGGFVEEMH